MSNDITVTLRGFCGTTPAVRAGAESARPWAQFRMASTPSSRDAEGVWHDGETVWVTVKTFGRLAQNVGESLRKSDPVVVVGRLRTESWRGEDGEERSTLTVVADAVGHDLALGTSRFSRVVRRADGTPVPEDSGDGGGRIAGDRGRTQLGSAPDDATDAAFRVEQDADAPQGEREFAPAF